jgi:hypothetical protein
MSGVAYYDIISLGNATWEDRADTGGRGFAVGCGRRDHGDDNHSDDDHDVDNGDDLFDANRHEHW